MQRSIQIAYNELFEKKCSLAAAAGFHYIAVDFTQIEDTTEYAWNVHTENIQRILEKNGLVCIQSHPYFYGMAESSEIMVEEREFAIRQAIIASAKLGAKWCALHPRTSVNSGFKRSVSLEDNRRAFSNYLEVAVKYGTCLGAENLRTNGTIRPVKSQYCSNYEDLCELVDSFHDEHMRICWDFGHANLMHFDQAEAVRYLGKRICCTHVHNNNGVDDLHLTPETGTVDWTRVMPALASIGFDGPLTLETHCYHTDDDLLLSFAKYNYACLAYLEKLSRAE